ncbi:hypothetical protein K432DRAFT_377599 [Lepidopterella palustris CBS 459.81]|uniref:F-box domain-containing protein n=1 Tax=Lepidopterella palustris CBS 459.81 TaxID=1314670 RepID=A0A8E2EKD3_9PEZI|nr:hypothetical protein K432DRAFT_377599 [Lepidopterella palustris CBS 459.81]
MKGELLSMPEELVDNICQFLEVEDLLCLRSTCRNIKDKSYHQFATRFFCAREFLVTHGSLQGLIDISKDKKFGPCMREVIINTGTFPPSEIQDIDGEPIDTSTIPGTEELFDVEERSEERELLSAKLRKERRRTYAKLMHEQHTLRKQSIDVAMLAEAFRNLPNLDTIQISDEPIKRRRKPWGASEIRRKIGTLPTTIGDRSPWDRDSIPHHKKMATRVLAVVLSAIAASEVKLKVFKCFARISLDIPLPKTPKHRSLSYIPSRTLSESHFELLKPFLNNLKSIQIMGEDDTQLDWLERIIPDCVNVEKLFIRGRNNIKRLRSFLTSRHTFPALRALTLSDIVTSAADLFSLLSNYTSTLESLHIKNSKIYDGPFAELLKRLQRLPQLRHVTLTNNRVEIASVYESHSWVWSEESEEFRMLANTRPKTELVVRASSEEEMGQKLRAVMH